MKNKLSRLNPTYWKPFRERNLMVTGMIGVVIVVVIIVASLQYDKIPFLSSNVTHTADFAELGGLKSSNKVEVSGKEVGKVTAVTLDGDKVRVEFSMDKNVRLGTLTEAAIKTETALGAKFLAITPKGEGHLSGAIPLTRTTSPYQLPDAIGDLTNTISGLDTVQLSDSLTTLSKTFKDTPDDLRVAVDGVSRLSDTINARDAKLRGLLGDANKVTAILAKRSGQITQLVGDVDTLLVQLQARSDDIDQLMGNIAAVSQQLSGVVADNRDQIGPALDKLNGVLDILNKRKRDVQLSIKRLNAYAGSLSESVGSGPFFKAYLVNLLPGQFLQPFVDAAFRKQGLNPDTLIKNLLPPQYQPGTQQNPDLSVKNPDPTQPPANPPTADRVP